MEDKEIVRLYWERNELAIKETSAKYGWYCHKIAYNILQNREDADESVNDTWLRTWECIPPHLPEVLSAFVGKITRRVSLNDTVKFRFTEYDGEEADDVKEKLSAEGHLESEENPDRLLYIDENGIVKNVRVYTKNGRTVALFYQYPEEAIEGFGSRLEYIAGSFQWRDRD